uniref:Uncharacterized protein n=1 Tax=Hyaloperonospora arabidopsidis (strain Emoy2) TaxID=559515 RepID=M4C1P4_HYAAE
MTNNRQRRPISDTWQTGSLPRNRRQWSIRNAEHHSIHFKLKLSRLLGTPNRTTLPFDCSSYSIGS